jgi:hypothetical protein
VEQEGVRDVGVVEVVVVGEGRGERRGEEQDRTRGEAAPLS